MTRWTDSSKRGRRGSAHLPLRQHRALPQAGLLVLAVAWMLGTPSHLSAQAMEWIRQFAQQSEYEPGGVATDSTGIYVAGTTLTRDPDAGTSNFDGFLKKYSPTGDELWYQQIATPQDDQVIDIAAHDSNNYIVGTTFGTFPGQVSSGDLGIFIARYDSDGYRQWIQQFATTDLNVVSGLAIDETGVYVAWGAGSAGFRTVSKFSFSGALIWSRESFFASLGHIGDSNPGFYMAGSLSTGINGSNAVLQSFDPNGDLLWSNTFGTPQKMENAQGVSASSNAVYVAGVTRGQFPGQTSAGDLDAFVTKFDTSGNLLWTRQFGTQYVDSDDTVAADDTGVFVSGLAGYGVPLGQSGTNGGDAYVRRYDGSGILLWNRELGSPAFDDASFLALQGGKTVAAGLTRGTITGENPSQRDNVFLASFTVHSDTISVITNPQCPWSAVSNADWLMVPTATIDSVSADVQFYGGAPGFVGLDQVNVRVPPDTRTAPDITVRIMSGDRQSNVVTIPVGP